MNHSLQDLICKNKFKQRLSRLTKRKLWELYNRKKAQEYQDLTDIKSLQLKKLRILMEHASAAPYYRTIIDSMKKPIETITLGDLKRFPVLTKDIVRKDLQHMITKKPSELYPDASGGSTGEPLKFYHDQNYYNNIWASMMIINEMCGWYYGARTVRLWGTPRDVKAFSDRRRLFFQNTRFYDAFNMSDEKLERFHREMTDYKPEFIMSTSSSIYLLANYLRAKGLRPAYPSISISVSSENFYDHMRAVVEDTFGIKCFNRYGGREIGAIACECPAHEGLHLFMDNVLIECIDQQTGEDVLDKPGELFITDLNNFGMPFIRYKMGDLGILTEEYCSCGRKTLRLKEFLGRNIDQIILKNGKVIYGCYFNHYFLGIEGLKAYQFIQEAVDGFTLNIVRMDNFDAEKFRISVSNIQDAVGHDATVTVNFVDDIPKAPSGKVQFIISKVDPATIWGVKTKEVSSPAKQES